MTESVKTPREPNLFLGMLTIVAIVIIEATIGFIAFLGICLYLLILAAMVYVDEKVSRIYGSTARDVKAREREKLFKEVT